jgi:hypothetical protein
MIFQSFINKSHPNDTNARCEQICSYYMCIR